MSSQDEDVAAILGLPSARFAPREGAKSRPGGRGLALFAVTAVALALGVGAFGLLSRRAPPSPELQVAQRPVVTRQIAPTVAPSAAETLNVSGTSVSSSSAAPAAVTDAQGSRVSEAAAPPLPPPPPPPPSAETLAEIRSAGAAPREITTAPSATLKTAKVDRLTAPQVVTPDVEEAAPASSSPGWLAAPTGEEVADAYPADAMRDGLAGSVVMACTERIDGRVSGCRILDERPFGAGFGRAALRLSRRFRFSPILVDGRPIEAEVRIPYDFSVVD